ncbi:hypothetical protein [Paenibacillus larvae]|uniref:hypothetical protein n=1 Tax=Paenibacillus larvae TaxID=1464 RepID=UPI0022832558|nr:hypothetical protein [Paenibacillus larvae]MCY9750357.1 hypothetical protein [Paenibacillus larvae]MCY9774458.1 hypothetical protein [Paenibacillus larvae]
MRKCTWELLCRTVSAVGVTGTRRYVFKYDGQPRKWSAVAIKQSGTASYTPLQPFRLWGLF